MAGSSTERSQIQLMDEDPQAVRKGTYSQSNVAAPPWKRAKLRNGLTLQTMAMWQNWRLRWMLSWAQGEMFWFPIPMTATILLWMKDLNRVKEMTLTIVSSSWNDQQESSSNNGGSSSNTNESNTMDFMQSDWSFILFVETQIMLYQIAMYIYFFLSQSSSMKCDYSFVDQLCCI